MKKKKGCLGCIGWLSVVVFAIICIICLSNTSVEKLIYPIHYEEEIKQNATKYSLDPYLIAAIIRVESNYKPKIESHKGAYGLMQLMPDTSEWIIKQGKFIPENREQLHQPSVSIELGSWYLNWLERQFDGNMVAAVAGYNAGQGKVQKWIQSGEWDGTLEHADQVPYGETRHYIQRVMYYQQKYTKLYGVK